MSAALAGTLHISLFHVLIRAEGAVSSAFPTDVSGNSCFYLDGHANTIDPNELCTNKTQEVSHWHATKLNIH